MFSGLRQSEILGLQWDDVDFDHEELIIRRQLQKQRTPDYVFLDETKNGKNRTVPISFSVIKVLRQQKTQQAEWKLAAGKAWKNDHNLVFTDNGFFNLAYNTVYLLLITVHICFSYAFIIGTLKK